MLNGQGAGTVRPVGSQSIAGRLIRMMFGYLLAVACGSVVFVLLTFFFLTRPPGLHDYGGGLWASMLGMTGLYFRIGVVFSFPYTLVTLVIFALWLPKSQLLFLILGALCPVVAALLLIWTLGGLQFIDREIVIMLLLMPPAGLAAAYIFGAIGMGYGFGRWRFG